MSLSSIWRPGKCECCGRGERDVAVCASAFGPTSEATCRECLVKPATPIFNFEYTWREVGNCDEKNIAPWVKNWYTFKDGRYIHWTTFVGMKKQEAAK